MKKLPLYFFRQYLPSFFFGFILFSFIFLIDRLFDLLDLILNKGVSFGMVFKLLILFVPTAFPLSVPMAMLLGCMVSFGRLSEENEIMAVRAAGIGLGRVLWLIPFFSLFLSFLLIPFNTVAAPKINRAFREIYEKIIHADPLINISERKFFSIKNIKIFAESVDKESNQLKDLFVYVLPESGRPFERVFARFGSIESDEKSFSLILNVGQLERYGIFNPAHLTHATFVQYKITVPLNLDKKYAVTQFRNITSQDLKKLIKEHKQKGFQTAMLEAEQSLRYALAYAPLCLVLVGIPLATIFKRGGKTFNTGMSLVVIFCYYLLLIFGLTLAEKGILPSLPALWLANGLCLSLGLTLFVRMIRR